MNPIDADQIVEQLQYWAGYLDPRATPLHRCDDGVTEGEGRRYRQRDYLRHGPVLLRKVLIESLGHARGGGDPRHGFNDAKGPDASRLILDFVLQCTRALIRSHINIVGGH